MKCIKCGQEIGSRLGMCERCDPSQYSSHHVHLPFSLPPNFLDVFLKAVVAVMVVFFVVVFLRRQGIDVTSSGPSVADDYPSLRIRPQAGVPLGRTIKSGVPLSDCKASARTEVMIHNAGALPRYTLPSVFEFACCGERKCLYYRGVPDGGPDQYGNPPPARLCCLSASTNRKDPPAFPCEKDPKVPRCDS
jgi:hypothetical protein